MRSDGEAGLYPEDVPVGPPGQENPEESVVGLRDGLDDAFTASVIRTCVVMTSQGHLMGCMCPYMVMW
ncbi:Uncharacterized protein DAT39_015057, partial [Clarias magur]